MGAIESHPDYATLSGPRPPREEWLQQWLGHEEDFDAETSASPFHSWRKRTSVPGDMPMPASII